MAKMNAGVVMAVVPAAAASAVGHRADIKTDKQD
jgi:hypothetical protein